MQSPTYPNAGEVIQDFEKSWREEWRIQPLGQRVCFFVDVPRLLNLISHRFMDKGLLAPAMLYNNVVALNYFYSVFGSFIKIY
jgi:hypothetical protein